MRFHVDGWDPSYGSSVDGAEGAMIDSTAKINTDVETLAADWAPVQPSAVTLPDAVLFVDGVRRIEARLWIEQPDTADPTTGATLVEGAAVMALCASYAAGTVCCCSTGAHLLTGESRRGLFTTAVNAEDVTTSAGDYRVNVTPDNPDENLAVLLGAALQRNLADLEVIVAANARSALADHGVPDGGDLLVIDGPLRGRTHLPRALGFIKSHRASYLPAHQNNVVSQLKAGERTPVFLMGTSWDRHSWYLRLPCRAGAPWAGIVRVECAADLSATQVIDLANLSQVALPEYASEEYKDTRAPQNLVSVAGLERELRRRLGSQPLLTRALRVAAVG